ncbi:hypothetical protein CF326_g393 [Tilletia indica]|nr:hypothetical protein CF326_g393 [Tilletia indica]
MAIHDIHRQLHYESDWHPGELEVVDEFRVDRACLKPDHDVGTRRESTTIHGWKRGNFIFPFVLLLPSDAETRPSATDKSTADSEDDSDGAELAMQKLRLYAQTTASSVSQNTSSREPCIDLGRLFASVKSLSLSIPTLKRMSRIGSLKSQPSLGRATSTS